MLSRATSAAALLVLGRQGFAMEASTYKLHVYDRVELLMSRFNIPYKRILYGYGEGADPASCDGNGYGTGPVALTGKKMLPVLEGDDVPANGAVGMPESLAICSFIVAKHGLVCPPHSGRDDVAAFSESLKAAATSLTRPRIIKMPVKDWADEKDIDYAKWKYVKTQGFDYEDAEAKTPQLIDEINTKLSELESLIQGGDSLNSWGWGMDDVLLLPSLRLLTVAKGVVFPKKVEDYMAATLRESKLVDYTQYAC